MISRAEIRSFAERFGVPERQVARDHAHGSRDVRRLEKVLGKGWWR